MKKYTIIFINEANFLPSKPAAVDSHSFKFISSTYNLNRMQKILASLVGAKVASIHEQNFSKLAFRA
jgi:hypothetical protein